MPDQEIPNYEDFEQKRANTTTEILDSTAIKKLIVAGPGTGKSYLFEQICKHLSKEGQKKIQALSFINELVEDLAKDLDGLADVSTLHSFALGLIPGDTNMFIDLSEVIERDYEIINKAKVDYNHIFCTLSDEKELLDFYSQRRKYYNFFSPNCSVYTLIKIIEGDENKIPVFDQLLIDEYQDFNKLESKLLFYLSKKNPVVVVGDDDQALYDFKYSEPDEIRKKYSSGDFVKFGLPYCSRCTKVILDSYSEIVEKATSLGHLKGRVAKEFLYFPSKKKDTISDLHPKITLKRKVYPNTLGHHIDLEIKKLVDIKKNPSPSVLIICPLRKHIKQIEKDLKSRGYKNIETNLKDERDELLEGYELLQLNGACNLGWRIVFEADCIRRKIPERFEEVLIESTKSNTQFKDILNVAERKIIKKTNASLRKIRDNQEIEEERLVEVFDILGYNPYEVTFTEIREKLEKKTLSRNIYKNTPIKIVTILGSKGLTRDHSFLVNFDDRYLLDGAGKGEFIVSDTSICKFLVSLTRARESVSIFTGIEKTPTYVQWISNQNINDQT